MDFIVFTLLTRLFTVNYQIANFISVNLGILNSFLLNRHYNFKVKDKTLKRLVTFYIVGYLGLALSSILLWLFIEKLNRGKH